MIERRHRLAFNPLYSFKQADGGLVGTAVWPSQSLRRECSGTSHAFPDVTHIDAQTLAELATSAGEHSAI